MPANSLTFSSVTTQVIPTAILLRFKTSKPYKIELVAPSPALVRRSLSFIFGLPSKLTPIATLFLNKYRAISSVINDPFVCICKTAGRLLF